VWGKCGPVFDGPPGIQILVPSRAWRFKSSLPHLRESPGESRGFFISPYSFPAYGEMILATQAGGIRQRSARVGAFGRSRAFIWSQFGYSANGWVLWNRRCEGLFWHFGPFRAENLMDSSPLPALHAAIPRGVPCFVPRPPAGHALHLCAFRFRSLFRCRRAFSSRRTALANPVAGSVKCRRGVLKAKGDFQDVSSPSFLCPSLRSIPTTGRCAL
jgi:hypothetical protein